MKKHFKPIFVFVFCSCFCLYWFSYTPNFKSKRAFYFWELNRWSIYEERATIDTLQIEKVYVKFFDIVKSPTMGIIPSSKTELNLQSVGNATREIIPCVYIENNVFKKTTAKELLQFVDNLLFLLDKRFLENNGSNYSEIQIDCDWTESTKANYFTFLHYLNEQTDKKISATLRLYAYKFPEKMGVLPVDRAMLMCYNLLSPIQSKNKNSILDLGELVKYLKGADVYPIPLDVALPIYSMVHIYRNGQFHQLFHEDSPDFKENLLSIKDEWFEVKNDRIFIDKFLRKGDRLKFEEISPDLLLKAIEVIKKNVHFYQNPTLSLFHLQENELNHFNYEELDSIYNAFNK